jgi:hypothetical protein
MVAGQNRRINCVDIPRWVLQASKPARFVYTFCEAIKTA